MPLHALMHMKLLVKTTDLVATRDEAIEWFSNQYKEMLTDNIDQYIELAKQQADKELSASKS